MSRKLRVVLIIALLVAFCPVARAAVVTFDFDTGAPSLHPTMPLPISQTSGGVTATFTGRFSVQSHDTTFYTLPNFSGNYLDPSDVFSPSLTILFDHQLTSIVFDFATADFGLDTNTTLRLTAYDGSAANPVAFIDSQAVGEGWGLGVLDFSSANAPFNLVQIVIRPGAGSDFLADNFVVTAVDQPVETVIPEPASLLMVATSFVFFLVFVHRRHTISGPK